jgi:hypothetical protein
MHLYSINENNPGLTTHDCRENYPFQQMTSKIALRVATLVRGLVVCTMASTPLVWGQRAGFFANRCDEVS